MVNSLNVPSTPQLWVTGYSAKSKLLPPPPAAPTTATATPMIIDTNDVWIRIASVKINNVRFHQCFCGKLRTHRRVVSGSVVEEEFVAHDDVLATIIVHVLHCQRIRPRGKCFCSNRRACFKRQDVACGQRSKVDG